MSDRVNGDVVRLLKVEHRVREGLAKVPPHRVGDDAVKSRGGADVANQPVDLVVKPAGQDLAFLPIKGQRLRKIVLRARLKKPRLHRPRI